MTQETEDTSEQSQDSLPNVNPVIDTQTELQELREQKKELESRVGTLANQLGKQREELEKQYSDYFAGLRGWYDEAIKSRETTILTLEKKLLEVSDEEGAKAIVQARHEREEGERQAANQRQQAEQQARQTLEQAITEASAALGVEPEALRGAKNVQQVWAMAGQASQQRQAQTLQEMVTKALNEAMPNRNRPAEDDDDDQEAASRTPSASRSSESAPVRGRRENEAVLAELKTLEERFDKARKANRVAQAFGLKRQIVDFKERHNLS